MNDDQIEGLFDATGKAVGFALAAALRSREDFSKNDGLLAYAQNLQALCEDDRFSPDVTLTLYGLIEGVTAFANLRTTDSDEIV